MRELTLTDFLASDPLPVLRIEVPELDGATYVRTFTAAERAEKLDELRKLPDAQFLAALAAFSLCDSAGKRLVDDQHLDALKDCNPVALERVAYMARRHNRLTKQDEEDLEKNWHGAPDWRFHLKLARAVGFNGRRSLYAGRNLPLTGLELAEWEADYRMEPWGERRGDLQAGIVAAALRPGTNPGDYALRFGSAEEAKQARLERAQPKLTEAGQKWGKQRRS